MGFFDKFLNKFTNRASDKLADKAVNKIFGNGKQQTTQTTQTTQDATTEPQTTTQTTQPTQTADAPKINPVEMAMISGMATKNAQAGMAQANEFMQYLIFDDEMNIVGVKDDAPDYLKAAYKSGKLTSKD